MELTRKIFIFLVATSLEAKDHRPVKTNPNTIAHWGGGSWVCPEGYRLPPGNLPTPENLPVTKEGKKTEIHCLPPAPHMPWWGSTPSDTSGVWDAPETFVESVEQAFGRKVWKHCKVEFPPLEGRVFRPLVFNMTHLLKSPTGAVQNTDYDPKNLVITRTSLEFDARAGDSIAWKVQSW